MIHGMRVKAHDTKIELKKKEKKFNKIMKNIIKSNLGYIW